MPLTSLQSDLSVRFNEIDNYLNAIKAMETTVPLEEDTLAVKVMRGLFFVHLYGILEFAHDQAFIRLAQNLNGKVEVRHLNDPILSLALDALFKSLRDTHDGKKVFQKRLELVDARKSSHAVSVPDTVLSQGFQTSTADVIRLACSLYDLKKPFADISTTGYISEVVSKRLAIAHGRESPIEAGKMKVADLRIRKDAIQNQTNHLITELSDYLSAKKYISQRHKKKYP